MHKTTSVSLLKEKMTTIEEVEINPGSWTRTFKDLFAGAAGGVAQVLLGQHALRTPHTLRSFFLVVSHFLSLVNTPVSALFQFYI